MGKSDNKLDGYTLTDRLRKTRRRHNLSAATQALYYELVAICNEEGWVDEFRCSNDELCSALKITEKSLIDYRQSLIQSGLIEYKSGKSKKQIGKYSFNHCKNYSQSDSLIDSQSGSQFTSQSVEKASDSNNDKRKTKLNETKKTSGAKPPVIEKKKVTEHWKKIVETWFEFYKSKYVIAPTFNGQAAKNLERIIEGLKRISIDPEKPWTEDRAIKVFNRFLTKAQSDKWLESNFLLNNLYSKFDSIIQKKEDGNDQKHSNSNNLTGGNLSSTAIIQSDKSFNGVL